MAYRNRSLHRFRGHSLSLVSVFLLLFWTFAYSRSHPDTHWGAFFGNAIADWSGSVVIILGTKYLLEAGSAESRPVFGRYKNPLTNLLYRHSLLLFIAISGVGWLLLYRCVDPKGKWGQVVSNIVSEWVQLGGLVFLTKSLVERGSKESRQGR
jgi:hypothetical protein